MALVRVEHKGIVFTHTATSTEETSHQLLIINNGELIAAYPIGATVKGTVPDLGDRG